jgi:hypothetical protein
MNFIFQNRKKLDSCSEFTAGGGKFFVMRSFDQVHHIYLIFPQIRLIILNSIVYLLKNENWFTNENNIFHINNPSNRQCWFINTRGGRIQQIEIKTFILNVNQWLQKNYSCHIYLIWVISFFQQKSQELIIKWSDKEL